MITISKINLSKSEIYNYLKQNAEIFTPPLIPRVDINLFSEKIHSFAHQFWAFHDDEKAGFLACYFNDVNNEIGYITSISTVKKFQGKGIGCKLISEAIAYGKNNGFKKIRIEVNKANTGAISFYEKFNFVRFKETDKSYFMEKSISKLFR